MRASLLLSFVVAGAAARAQPPEADGNDDPVDTGSGARPTQARFERVGQPRGAMRRVCDLRAHRDALYFTEAFSPLGSDGARVFRYAPGPTPFATAFDWNRPGEPARGGGGGQGFLRVRALDGRLVVPDADPPYGGFGLADPGTEGYVFLSDRQGVFAPPRMPGHRPPAPPDLPRDRGGAAVLPRAYHVIDAIRWRGHWIASTGSVPPRERAWRGTSPGALHVANATGTRWTYALGYPAQAVGNVWRLTYLVRFRQRLYAGIQDYFGREPNDLVTLSDLSPAALSARRVTPRGGAQTLRWYVHENRLWWITLERDGRTHLRFTDDGDRWSERVLPDDAGDPTDITRWRDGLVVLTDRGLWRLEGDHAAPIAPAPFDIVHHRVRRERVSHFRVDDVFCAAPLAVYRGDLYAGSQRDGSLWRIVTDTP
ncbi:MAG: hypothetical protein U0325_19950 [Polyangiales bacterium]